MQDFSLFLFNKPGSAVERKLYSKKRGKRGFFKGNRIIRIINLEFVLTNLRRYLKRENEPRDYELWSGDKPNLHQSTYKILGKQLDDETAATSADTETRFKHEEALRLKKEQDLADERDTVKEMVDESNKARLNMNINNYGNLADSCLMHQKGHDQHHLETTYNTDFEHPNPEMLNYKDEKMVNKKLI